MATDDLREYYLELARFIALLRDGHTSIRFPDEITKGKGKLPIKFEFIEGKYIITSIDESLDIKPFSEILKINDTNISEYLHRNIAPFCWHELEKSACARYINMIPIVEDSNSIEIQTDSGTYIVPFVDNIKIKEFKDIKISEKSRKIYESKCLEISVTEDNLYIIKIRNFNDMNLKDEFYSQLACISGARGIILDIRENMGGMTKLAGDIAQAFINGKFYGARKKQLINKGVERASASQTALFSEDKIKEFLDKGIVDEKSLKSNKRILNNEYFEINDDEFFIKDCPMTLSQPLLILTSNNTASAAEDFVIMFKTSDRGIILGEHSFGSTGTPLLGKLPGGGNFAICTRWYTFKDGTEFINKGIAPDIDAYITVEDYKQGVDTVLNRGLLELRKLI